MKSIVIRRLDESTKARLMMRAAKHGRSMEEEAREILTAAVSRKPGKSQNLAEKIHARFAALGGFELPDVPRQPMREPPAFEE